MTACWTILHQVGRVHVDAKCGVRSVQVNCREGFALVKQSKEGLHWRRRNGRVIGGRSLRSGGGRCRSQCRRIRVRREAVLEAVVRLNGAKLIELIK